ncbi:hypothetical protein Vretimale_18914 [Volvox reticuliferus]|uniref:Protease Do-like PDZ domain-containing protein n=1 Tax=Volvox reticuliferus TaxID=1737510 RepID=A0A8J4LZT0_9CHLO|nr:hypothetical protein Vretifemale_17236 [Volvox reticuliferus]GIM16252.1 hypothetical protein Vretimale_18914 [Volvox reticuliferus]
MVGLANGASTVALSARCLDRSSRCTAVCHHGWGLTTYGGTRCSTLASSRHGDYSPLTTSFALSGRSAMPVECGHWNKSSWVCHAAVQVVRRPPLRLQRRSGEPHPGGEGRHEPPSEQENTELAEKEGEMTASLLPGVVRVQCVQDLPRFDLPLLLGSFRSSTCNAVAVSYGDESYLLAPAASVAYGSQVRVLLPGRDKPFAARLLHLGMECELAVLGVDAPEFWEAVMPYELASYGLPHLQQHVNVVSYEDDQPMPRSSTGTVMRTEVVTYPSAMQRLLGITVAVALSKDQIGSAVADAQGGLLGLVFARTPGSAGGGKKAGGGSAGAGSSERWGQGRRRVGRRRGRRGQTEASATVVPAPVVSHFLEDIRRHGSFMGFPTLGIQWKRTESAALRRYTGMSHDQTGVVITSINPTAALAPHAQPLDVLAAVGCAAVGNDGTVEFRDGADSIHITYHISQFQVGDQVDLTLIRAGQLLRAPVVLGVPHRLLPLHLGGRPPQYLVVSGLVLTVLSAPFMEGAFGRSWAVRAPVQLLREWHNHPSRGDEQVVVVAECQDMGPGSATDGYERRGAMYQRIVRCNGTPVINLRHLVVLVAEAIGKVEAGGPGRAGGRSGRRHGAATLRAAGNIAPNRSTLPAAADMATTAAEGYPALGPAAGDAGRLDASAGHAAATGGPVTVDGASDIAVGAASAVETTGHYSGGPPYDPMNLVLELSNRMVLVLPLKRAREDTREMLAEYEVQHAVSEDLRPLYEKGLRLGVVAGASKATSDASANARGRGGGMGGCLQAIASDGGVG